MDINSLAALGTSRPFDIGFTAQNTSETDAATPRNDVAEISTRSNEEITQQFDTFLRLLTAQVENQDPLAPLDSTQFVEQLATFSQLELQAQGNQFLESISNRLAAQDAFNTVANLP